MVKRAILLVTILCFVCQIAFSQEASDTTAGEQPVSGDNESGEKEIRLLSLDDCIELAIKQNRDFIRQEEGFILDQLAYGLVKRGYGPLLSGSVRTDVEKGGTMTKSAETSLTQRLPTGGDVELSAQTAGSTGSDIDPDAYNSTIALKYIQPLLKDAGPLAYKEELTTAERELKYAERSLTLFKQEFLINIIRQYCRLLQQKKTITNQEQKVENAKFLLERSKAQMDRGKASPIDVYRAEISLLQAENDLLNSKDSYQLSLDEFKIDLGLPTEVEMELQDRDLRYAAEIINLNDYVKLALANRLDYQTAYDRVTDSKRRLDIARNRLRSRLDFDLSLQTQTGPAATFRDQDFGEGEWIVGLEYEIPFDRRVEKTEYRERLIDYLQQTRAREALRDQIVGEIRIVVRDIRKSEATIKIQERNIEVAEKQLDRAKEDYDRGAITNRDYVDAVTDLTDAKNSYNEAIVDYFIAQLDGLRVTGTLEFEKWKDLIK